ncbi:MoaD/ThiS family protein [Desulfonatronovibrio hydrogenovorans]|uniref:MoaD/ThiS family protein n=1 Tax=Desulfonatronovibrio hydrogenovorans TaxID=53245 RepID=UPI00048F609C|nr:MoaD/ThiS family protein [Desulfonatronovibrio hydrogenovorans]
MARICFKAFSFLQPRLRALGRDCFDQELEITENETVEDLVQSLGLGLDEVEAAFINGRVAPLSTRLKHGDSVALVPPGTPGPYRVLLGIRECKAK